MLSGYKIRPTGSGLSRSVQSRAVYRRHGPVLARPNKAACSDGGKRQDLVHRQKRLLEHEKRAAKLFSKNWSLAKIRCFALMNAHSHMLSTTSSAECQRPRPDKIEPGLQRFTSPTQKRTEGRAPV
jgi:hypothetical protein